MRFKRSQPFFIALLKAPTSHKRNMLRSFPQFVVDDLLEILYNVVVGHVDIGSGKRNLLKYRKRLINLANTRSKRLKREVMYQQDGGFLGALLPIVASVISGFIGNAMQSV